MAPEPTSTRSQTGRRGLNHTRATEHDLASSAGKEGRRTESVENTAPCVGPKAPNSQHRFPLVLQANAAAPQHPKGVCARGRVRTLLLLPVNKNQGKEIRLIEFVWFGGNLIKEIKRCPSGSGGEETGGAENRDLERIHPRLSSRDHISFPLLSSPPSLPHRGE